mgnify:CR=1 FL=1
MELPIINSVNLGNGLFKVTAALDNTKLNSGFDAKELGLMAKVGDNGSEVLFSYTNGGNYVDYIPDKNTVMDTYTFTITTVIGNAENVTAIHTDAGLTPLLTFNQHLQDADAHADVFANYLPLSGGVVTGSTSFRDTLTALTKTYSDNSTNVATTAFVQSLFTNFLTSGQANNTKLRDAVKAANLAGYHGITQDTSNPNSWWIKLPSGVIIQGINHVPTGEETTVQYPITISRLLGVIGLTHDYYNANTVRTVERITRRKNGTSPNDLTEICYRKVTALDQRPMVVGGVHFFVIGL